MNNFFNKFITGYLGSFDTTDSGFSRKKLIATSLSLMIIFMHIKWMYSTTDFSLMPTILTIDASLITALLGIGAIQAVQTKLTENPTKTTTQKTIVTENPATVTNVTENKEPVK